MGWPSLGLEDNGNGTGKSWEKKRIVASSNERALTSIPRDQITTAHLERSYLFNYI